MLDRRGFDQAALSLESVQSKGNLLGEVCGAPPLWRYERAWRTACWIVGLFLWIRLVIVSVQLFSRRGC